MILSTVLQQATQDEHCFRSKLAYKHKMKDPCGHHQALKTCLPIAVQQGAMAVRAPTYTGGSITFANILVMASCMMLVHVVCCTKHACTLEALQWWMVPPPSPPPPPPRAPAPPFPLVGGPQDSHGKAIYEHCYASQTLDDGCCGINM